MGEQRLKHVIQSWGAPEGFLMHDLEFVFDTETYQALSRRPDPFCLGVNQKSVSFAVWHRPTHSVLFAMMFFLMEKEPSETEDIVKWVRLFFVVTPQPMHRRKGVCSHYLKQLVQYAATEGYPRLKLTVDPDDEVFQFIAKEKGLTKRDLWAFYRRFETEAISFEIN